MDKKEKVVQVYGRTSYEEPLSFVKEMTVKTSLAEEVLAEVGNDGWIELIAIPSNAFLHVIGEKENDDETTAPVSSR